MRHLLLVLAAGSLLAAADSTDTITVDGLPESVRNQLPQTINGGVVLDVQVDRHNGQPQYIVHYHGQDTTQVQTVRLGSNGTVLNDALIATPSRDGTSGNLPAGKSGSLPTTPVPQALPGGSGADSLPSVPPGTNVQAGTTGGSNTTTTIPLPPGAAPTTTVQGSAVSGSTVQGSANQNAQQPQTGANGFPNGANTLSGANIPNGANTVNGANIPTGANTVNGANTQNSATGQNNVNTQNGVNVQPNTQNGVNTQNNANTQNGVNTQNSNARSGTNSQGGTSGSANAHGK